MELEKEKERRKMTKKKIHFMGLLANTDSSILKVELDHGFKIESISFDKGINLISTLKRSTDEAFNELSSYACLEDSSGEQLYFVSNSFESDSDMSYEGRIKKLGSHALKFESKVVRNYLDTTVRLMRLFKEGNICIPLRYYFYMDDKTPKFILSTATSQFIKFGPKYTLKNSKISNLQKFIQNTKLPFKESFLQLAFENFELSYKTHNDVLAFLSLMIGLETLFNPGGGELKYRISRNTAVLLGKNKEDSKLISSEIKKLYDMRSKIVHTGRMNIIKEKELLKLRYYVRKSIKEIYKIGKNKDDLLDMLNSYGFGERPWRDK